MNMLKLSRLVALCLRWALSWLQENYCIPFQEKEEGAHDDVGEFESGLKSGKLWGCYLFSGS